MGSDFEPDEARSLATRELTLEQLKGLQHGVAATIMPVNGGWRVFYYGSADFDDQPGTTFARFEDAMDAIEEILPEVNSPQEKRRARDEFQERLRRSPNQPA